MLADSAVVDRACGLNARCDSRMRSLAGPSDRFDSSCRLGITSRVLLKQNRTYAGCKHTSVKTVAYTVQLQCRGLQLVLGTPLLHYRRSQVRGPLQLTTGPLSRASQRIQVIDVLDGIGVELASSSSPGREA